MTYLLDTDHLSLWQRGNAEGMRIRERVRRLAPDDYGITIVTYAEQVKGWLAAVGRAQTPEAEVLAFREMQQSLQFCTALAIWGFTQEAAQRFEGSENPRRYPGFANRVDCACQRRHAAHAQRPGFFSHPQPSI